MNESNALVILQTVSLTTSICTTLLLGLSFFHMRNKNRMYEKVRWMLFTAGILLTIHYWAQIHFGFRAQGDDVGALVNILFYTPAAFLISCAIIHTACGNRYMKRYWQVSVISSIAIIALFFIGLITYESLHMQHALYTMGGVFFLTMVFFIIAPSKEIRRMRRRLEDETGIDLQNYDLYMKVGTRIVLVLSAFLPLAIFSKYVLAIFGPIYLVSLFFYMLCFVSMGFSMMPMQIIDDTEPKDSKVSVDTTDEPMDADMVRDIEEKLEKWVATRAFCNPEMNIMIMSRQTSIDKQILTRYLTTQKGVTFRIWLSDLRIEQVKTLLLENVSYTNETVAAECGFSSRSWMHQRFKEVTGLTPSEWKRKKLTGK